ncbi:MAG: preprotein translocase subunit SecE [Chloroflexi bacterium]|nr:MAG: preprotein translocase subunit SecE [Chloroflexota bacterium]
MARIVERWPFKFFSEVIAELRKVSWLSRQELIRLGLMVIVVTVAAGIVLGLVDYGFSKLIEVVLLR